MQKEEEKKDEFVKIDTPASKAREAEYPKEKATFTSAPAVPPRPDGQGPQVPPRPDSNEDVQQAAYKACEPSQASLEFADRRRKQAETVIRWTCISALVTIFTFAIPSRRSYIIAFGMHTLLSAAR